MKMEGINYKQLIRLFNVGSLGVKKFAKMKKTRVNDFWKTRMNL
jgi:hypothetical protein